MHLQNKAFLKHTKKTDVICDAGCGDLTLLGQLKTMGYQNLYGFDIDEDIISEELENKDYYTSANVFWVPSASRWSYVQDKDKHTNHWHNHSKSASVNFVTYLRPGAAGLQVIDVCPWDGPKVIELEVVEGVMYTMPGWMMHKPATNWSNEARVSINCEFTYDTHIEVNGHKWA